MERLDSRKNIPGKKPKRTSPARSPRGAKNSRSSAPTSRMGGRRGGQGGKEYAHLATFPEMNPNPVLEIDREGRVLYLNPAARRLFPDLELMGPRHPFLAGLDSVVSALEEQQAPSLDRTVQIGCSWYRQTFYLPPEPGRLRIYAYDNTGQMEALRKAEDSERKFRALYEGSRDGYAFTDLAGTILEFNTSFKEMLGYPEEELKRLTYQDLTPPRWRDREAQILREEVFVRGYSKVYEKEYRRKDGTIFPVSLRTYLARDSQGSPAGMWAFVRDITPRKKMEEELAKSRDRFALLSEITAMLLESEDPGRIVQDLCRKVMAHMDCHACFNYLLEEGRQRLRLNAYAGISEEEARGVEWLDFGGGFCGCVARDGVRFVAENIPDAPDPRTDLLRSHGIKAYACHPLISGERVIGTLSFGSRSRPAFTEEDLSLLKTISDQVAIALEKDLLMREIRRSRDDLELEVEKRTKELSRAYRDLAERSRILDSFFKYTQTPLVLLDRDFNFIRVNEAYAGACRRKAEDFPGQNHFDLYPHEENREIFRRVVETKAPYRAQAKPFTFPDHPDWGITYWDWTLTPLLDGRGEVEYLVFALNDVTERKGAEERLRQSEGLLKNILELLPVGVWIVSSDGVITYGNPAGRRVWGGERYVGMERFGEYRGWFLPSGKRIEPEEWAAARAINRGETTLDEEIEIEGFDGRRRVILNSAIPLRDGGGKITGAFVLNQDITERRQTEQRLRQMQKMEALGTLAGGIAHDFNNILMPIVINTEMALLDLKEKVSPSPHLLNLVLEAARRGQELVRQIITYSRQKEQPRTAVDILPVVKEALKFLRSTVPANIDIRSSIGVESAVISADPTQIHQVLMNLCTNAAAAMTDGGGIVEVSLDRVETLPESVGEQDGVKPGPYLRITVRDNGRGMDREVRERAFDPFFTTKKPGEGTGMGLAVVLGIVKNHEGAITLESEVGRGTTVQVFLPWVQAALPRESIAPGKMTRGNERILVVDDEKVQVESVREALERLGYRVTGETDPREALEAFRERPDSFDLVITDQAMPGMTGYQLAGMMLRLRPDLPIILCTGFSEAVDEEAARALGVRDFALKPLNVGDLAERVRKVLKK